MFDRLVTTRVPRPALATGVSDALEGSALGATTARFPAFVLGLVVSGWIVAILASIRGWGAAFGHGHLIEHGPAPAAALGLYLVGWVVMIAAMMLPSSLDAVRWFDGVEALRGDPRRRILAFLSGYFAIWVGLGALAFIGDVRVHRFVDGWPWLSARPWLIGAVALMLAGGYELSPLARRCGMSVAHLRGRLADASGRDGAGAVRLGAGHAVHRLRRCWGLMVLSFAVGMANLGWMVVLTLLMVLQERGHGRRATLAMGIVLVGVGVVVALHPSWAPTLVPAES